MLTFVVFLEDLETMLEYILFHEKTVALFKDFLESKGLEGTYTKEEEYYQIALPDELDDDIWDQVEDKHAELMDMSQAMHYEEHPEEMPLASIVVTLKEGRKVDAMVSPDILMRVLDRISFEELDEVVAAIAYAVENPDAPSFCETVLERREHKLVNEG